MPPHKIPLRYVNYNENPRASNASRKSRRKKFWIFYGLTKFIVGQAEIIKDRGDVLNECTKYEITNNQNKNY